LLIESPQKGFNPHSRHFPSFLLYDQLCKPGPCIEEIAGKEKEMGNVCFGPVVDSCNRSAFVKREMGGAPEPGKADQLRRY
jgi:hypothetical protein